jgi:hypothetical protein
MVRGNHEDCMQRAGEGWFRFLDHAPLPQECSDLTGFFVVEYPDLNFLVMDNARAEAPKSDAGKRTQVINQLSEQFSKFRDSPLLQRDTWLLSHRPFNGLRFGNDAGYRSDNDIQQEAVKVDDREKVRMIVSGHIHIFEALSFGNSGPPQLVVGTAGDNLEDIPPQQIIGAKINDKSVEHGLVFARFGYMVWDKTAAGWTGRFFDDDGRQLAHCSLEKRSLTCTGKEDN